MDVSDFTLTQDAVKSLRRIVEGFTHMLTATYFYALCLFCFTVHM